VSDATEDEATEELECEARRERLGDLLAFVERACARAALEPDTAFDVRLATEEVVTNVIEHAYAGAPAPGPITVRFHHDPRQVVVTIDDLAPPFDPATVRPADPSAPLEQRRIGGLGWYFVNRVMDEVRHEHRHPRGNRLTLVKRLVTD
jgi:anti-sigma regulatory factor (Ser/Thr protein kinase)